jgi:hypothetical protein
MRIVFFVIFIFSFNLFASLQEEVTAVQGNKDQAAIIDKTYGIKINLGGGLGKGNSDYYLFNGDFATYRNFTNYTINFLGDMKYQETDKVRNVNSAFLTLGADARLTKHWGFTFIDTLGHDQFTKIKLKNIIGAGPLYTYKDNLITNYTSLVFAYNYQKYLDGSNLNEVVALLRNQFLISINSSAKFSLDFFYIPRLNNFRDYVIKLIPKIETKLLGDWLSFFVSSQIIHDSYPFAGVEKTDIYMLTGLSMNFEI